MTVGRNLDRHAHGCDDCAGELKRIGEVPDAMSERIAALEHMLGRENDVREHT